MELLQKTEPHPLETFNEHADSPYLLICEHAGNRLPIALGNLGLSGRDLARHIAWDIGARAVALKLAEWLHAPVYMQRYSRLVCDCNRRPDAPTFIVEQSEDTDIPGNVGLSQAERSARTRAIFWSFHDAISAALDRRKAGSRRTILLTIHSFTPVFLGCTRPWEIGVLFNRDQLLARSVAAWLQQHTSLRVGVNQPYKVGDETDYAIPVHGEKRALPCIEFEIRNDLIPDDLAAERWAETIGTAVTEVVKQTRLLERWATSYS